MRPTLPAWLVHYASLLVALVLFSWLTFSVLPVDPVRAALGPQATEETVALRRAELGLDQPWWRQLGDQFVRVATWSFGHSLRDGTEVLPEVVRRSARTFALGAQAALLALAVGYGAAPALALLPRRHWLRAPVYGIVALPGFVTALLAAIAVGAWLPGVALAPGSDRLWPAPWLPSLLAALYPGALMTLMLLDRIDEGRGGPAHRALLAAGVSRWRAYHSAIFRPAAATWLAAWLNQLSVVLVACLLLEIVFSIPGGGLLLVRAVQGNDLPVLQAVLIVNATVFIVLHALGEAGLARLRRTRQGAVP